MKTSRDSAATIKKKVKALLSKMTLEEKVAQLGGAFVAPLTENGKFSPAKAGKILKRGIGHISAPAMTSGLPLREVVDMINDIQKYLKQNTRLGIPAIVHEEALSGFMAPGATTFPQAIGLASTFNPQLVQEVTALIRRQMRAIGSVQGLSPVLDVLRDPRWGRTEETLGEDPYLVARMGAAYIQGLQGADLRTGVAATPKHFAAHGFPEGGRNSASVHVGARELREVFLFPFEAAIRVAGARSLMNAYHELDGTPCAANRALLTGILREEWGFRGFVVSDYGSIRRLENVHRVAADAKQAAIMALEAGIDIELPGIDCYGAPLLEAVREGSISEATVDEAVRRVLRAKFDLGLFEKPFVDVNEVPRVFDTPAARTLARQTARESIVLLKNDGLLPLSKDLEALAVIGPNADSGRNLYGDYAYTAHVDEKNDLPTVTVLEGIRKKVSRRTAVHYAQGCEVTGTGRSGFAPALEAARRADIVVAVLGERAGLRDLDISGEGRDRASLNLPAVQEDLLKALIETGKPVVLVLINGRPLSLGRLAERLSAVVEAWLPGEEGGRAVADVLFGDVSPGGKLPISIPREVGQIPVHYYRKPSGIGPYVGTDAAPPSREESRPLYPFGHGLSYTTFRYSALSLSPRRCGPAGKVTVRCRVANTGRRAGDEVVQLYVRDDLASVSRPVKELKGFRRLTLQPGERRTLTFRLSVEQLAFYDRAMRLVVEPGTFTVMVGSSSEDIRLTGAFEVVGPTKVITAQRCFFSETEVT